MTSYTKLYQLSDIHIKGPRYTEYLDVFKKTLKTIYQLGTENAITVICGDIFHHKKWISPQDLRVACLFLRELSKATPVVIIPGNHDMNLNNKDQPDLITPIMEEVKDLQNVTFYKKSGVYENKNINFCHIGMFDEEIPDPPEKKPGMINIALLHEEINGAATGQGYTFSGFRMSKEILSRYDLALAGHIHDYQFITPTIAYCGSLLQQDVGEKDAKGFLSWNLTSPKTNYNGTFHRIFNDHVYLKIFIINNKVTTNIDDEHQSPKFAHKIYVDYRASSVETVTKAITEYEAKYNKKVDRVVCSDQMIKQPNAQDVLNNHVNQENLIKEFLGKTGHDETMMEKVIGYHREYLMKRGMKERSNNVKWTLEFLTWKNLFCYHGGNAIDFTRLRGITGIIAKNKSGKSSVLDILVFALFNKLVRGDRKTIVNNTSKGGYDIQLGFRLGKDKYMIHRWERVKGRGDVSFTKNGEENLTQESVDKTYESIKKIVGTYDDFMATLISLQDDDCNLVKIGRLRRKTVLNKLFGVDLLEDMENEVKADIKETKTILKAKKPPVNTEEELMHAINDIAIEEHKAEAEHSESDRIQEIETNELAKLYMKLRSTNEYDIKDVERRLESAQRQAEAVRRTINPANKKIAEENSVEHLNRLLTPIDEVPPIPLEDLKRAIELVGKEIDRMGMEEQETFDIDELTKHKLNLQNNLDLMMGRMHPGIDVRELGELTFERASQKVNNLKAQLVDRNETMITIIQKEQELGRQKTVANERIVHFQEKIAEFESKKTNKYPDMIEKQKEIVETERAQSKYQYSDSCQCCVNNKIRVDKRLVKAEELLRAYEGYLKAEQEGNKKIQHEIDKLNEKIARSRIDETTYNQVYTNIQSQKNLLIEMNDAVEKMEKAKKIEHNRIIMAKTDEIKKLIAEIEAKLDKSHDSSRKVLKLAELERKKTKALIYIKTYEALSENKRINDLLNKISIYNSKKKTLDELEARIIELTEKLEILKSNEIINKEIEMRKASLEKHREIVRARHFVLTKLAAEKQTYTDQLEYCIEFNRENKNMLEKLPILEVYLKCLNAKNGIPNMLVCKTVTNLEYSTNQLLAKVTDFTIKFSNDSNLDMYLIQNDKEIPIELGSGFQKFVVNILMRIALAELSDVTLSTFLIIDEGFGCLDKENLENIQHLFTQIAPQFSCILIISHVEELQSILNNPLVIDVSETCSTLNNNSKLAEQQDEVETEKSQETEDPIFLKQGDKLICKVCEKMISVVSKYKHIKSKAHEKKVEEKGSIEN